jgi:hypothetical protein
MKACSGVFTGSKISLILGWEQIQLILPDAIMLLHYQFIQIIYPETLKCINATVI